MFRTTLAGALLTASLLTAAVAAPPVLAQETIELRERADIVDVQERLANLGWYHGAIDGIVGSGTLSAANAYRRAAGIATSQRIDKELQLQLHFINSDLRRGTTTAVQRDPEVRRAQEMLELLGYYRAGVDGISGPQTREAVTSFRRDQGIAGGTGVDRQLLDALDEELVRQGRI